MTVPQLGEGTTVDGSLTDETLDLVSERIVTLLDAVEAHSDADLRETVSELLQQIDVLHREALARILQVAQQADPGLHRLQRDPIVNRVLSLYDLLPDLLSDDGSQTRSPALIPLTVFEPKPQPKWQSPSSSFIPLTLVQKPGPMRAPLFVDALGSAELHEGAMRGLDLDAQRLLLCRVSGEVYAFRNRCPGSMLPLDLGRLDGTTILCPWHECRFDARTGRRLDGGDGRLEVIPVSEVDGVIRLALGVQV